MTTKSQVYTWFAALKHVICQPASSTSGHRERVLETRHGNRREQSQRPEVDSRADAFFKDSLK